MPRRLPTQPLAVQILADADDLTPLPPLFPIRTPEQAQLHDRVYHLLALALRAYILTWYSRITPRDRTFLPAVNRDVLVPLIGPILASIADDTRPAVDLLLLHLPTLAATHVQTYWAARAAVAAGLDEDTTLAAAYHARMPLLVAERNEPADAPATYVLSPAYLCALIDAFLALRLPEADLAADAERLVVREVVARAVLVSVGRRLSAPWFYAQIFLKLLGQPGEPRKGAKEKPAAPPMKKGFRKHVDAAVRTYRAVVAAVALLYTAVTWLFATLKASPPARREHTRVIDPWVALGRALLGIGPTGRALASPSSPAWPVRAAWSSLELILALLSPALDRLLPHLLDSALTAKTGLRVAELVDKILFPNDGYPGPSPIDPTPEEAAALDVALRARVAELLPTQLLNLCVVPVPPGSPADALVDPFSDSGCNVHLVGMLYNAVVATLLPDLVVGGAVYTPPVDDEKTQLDKYLADDKEDIPLYI